MSPLIYQPDSQPEPQPTGGPSMHDLAAADLRKSFGDSPAASQVIDDLLRRKAFGEEKYGTLLQAGNGRDAVTDAYDEQLDCLVYLMQAITETPDSDRWRLAYLAECYSRTAQTLLVLTALRASSE